MKRMTYTSVVAGVVTATGIVVAGCSGGGGGGGGGSTLPPISVGSVSTNLPTYLPDSAGYSYGSTQLNTTRGGRVTGVGVAPTGTATFAAHFPLARVESVDNDRATLSGTFFYDAQSIVAVGTQTFAGTANAARAGAGDVYEFRNGAWAVVHNSADSEAVVGAVNSEAWAATGGVNRRGELLRFDAISDRFVSVAALDSFIPTAIADHERELWLGATANDGQGGAARLFHRSPAGAMEELGVPGAGGGFGIRQEITGMVSVASVQSGSSAFVGSEILVIAVGAFEVATGNAVSGVIVAMSDGQFEVMHSMPDDAPTSIAFHDNTIFVGTGKGKLLLRDQQGAFVEETLPVAMTRIESIVSHDRDRSSLQIGGASSAGALLVRRSGMTGYVAPVSDRYYRPDVKQLLLASCASCHAGGALPAASSVFGLSAGLTNDTADFNATRGKVNLTTPASSLLIQKAKGLQNHLGGALIQPGSAQESMLLAWVSQGARLEAAVTPPPQPTTKTWVTDVAPILANLACSGCHNGSAGGYRLINGGGGMADYTETLQEVNNTTPENSQILRYPSQNGVTHTGGTRYAQGSANYNTILQWIQQGARYQ